MVFIKTVVIKAGSGSFDQDVEAARCCFELLMRALQTEAAT